MDRNLDGKVVIITGGAAGIGRGAAMVAAREGARLVLVDIDLAGLNETADLVRGAGAEATVVTADVSQSDSVKGYVDATMAAYGRIDGLFNNAGIQGRVASIADLAPEDFDRVIAINVRGVFLGLHHVLPVMIAQGSGSIVNTGSLGSARALPYVSAYVAAKHAVIGLTKTAAIEVATQGVRVNAVLPGNIVSPMSTASTKVFIPGADPVEAMGRMVPQKRAGQPEEIGEAVCFLLSDRAGHITGVELPVDGGILANCFNMG